LEPDVTARRLSGLLYHFAHGRRTLRDNGELASPGALEENDG
jgi:hypothetical protein